MPAQRQPTCVQADLASANPSLARQQAAAARVLRGWQALLSLLVVLATAAALASLLWL